MSNYQLTREAENDLEALFTHGLMTYGIHNAECYLSRLYEKFASLAEHPHISPTCPFITPEVRRNEYGAHSIYYEQKTSSHIVILRILHKRMDPAQHIE